jgi:transposase
MSGNELPDDIQELKNRIIELHNQVLRQANQLSNKDQKINHLQDLVNLLQRKKYAPQSEQVNWDQMGLFNEVEDLAASPAEEDLEEADEKETITYERSKKKKRARLPENLPRQEVIIDLEDKDKTCVHDGAALKKIGEEVSEKLEIVPAKVFVQKTIRYVYACPCCDEGMKTAPAPKALLPKTMASPSLVAYMIIAKFMDGLPLYRQEKIYARIGVALTRQSMARWLIEVSQKLMPLYNLLQEDLLSRHYLNMDETTVQVLKEDGKKATSKSYMWVRYASGINPIVLYDYSPTRSGQVPLELLEGFSGYLQVDGYDGYSMVCEKNKLTRLGCMDHARRKFKDAFSTSGGKDIGKRGLIFFKSLYKIEDDIEKLSPNEKKRIRQEKSKPILEEMKKWVDEKRPKITPKSVSGKAINYFYNEYKYLVGYLEDGRLNISNCGVENKIRPFAIGRKNWLFSDSVEGAKSSAMFYSLIETAKANNVEPFDWLKRVLEKLPYAETIEDYEELLPFSKKMT